MRLIRFKMLVSLRKPVGWLHSFLGFRRTCLANHAAVLPTLLASLWRQSFYGVKLIAPWSTRIQGTRNIDTSNGFLNMVLSCGVIDGDRPTVLDIRGQIRIQGNVSLARGCLVDVGPGAIVEIGPQTYINPRTQLVIKHGLRIGHHCAISWECQFLDEDFHQITYEGQRLLNDPRIVIGDHVWIGSRVCVYKGTVIPNGCVVASNLVVKGIFTEENALLAGNPAKIVRRNVQW